MGMYKIGLDHVKEPYKSLLAKLLNHLKSFFSDSLISVVLYGSVARGDNKKDSDLDLMIIVKDLPRGIGGRIRLFEEVENALSNDLDRLFEEGYYISFSPILKTVEEAKHFSPIYLDMVEDAVIIYDRNLFFKGILDRLLIRLEEIGAERVWVGRKWYWRLKKDYRFGEVIKIEL